MALSDYTAHDIGVPTGFNTTTKLNNGMSALYLRLTNLGSPIVFSLSRVLVTDSDGKFATSTITSTELSTLSGVTSNIQTQINYRISALPVAITDAAHDLAAGESLLHVTKTTTGICAIQLMTAQCTNGRSVTVKDAGGNAGANNITISTEGAETIDGAATLVINTNYAAVTLYSDGTNWFVI